MRNGGVYLHISHTQNKNLGLFSRFLAIHERTSRVFVPRAAYGTEFWTDKFSIKEVVTSYSAERPDLYAVTTTNVTTTNTGMKVIFGNFPLDLEAKLQAARSKASRTGLADQRKARIVDAKTICLNKWQAR